MELFLLNYFNIKERHYIDPPINAKKSPLLLLSLALETQFPNVGMLLPVVTADLKFILSSVFKQELEQSCYSTLNIKLSILQVWISKVFTISTFSIRPFLELFNHNFQDPLETLNISPSVLYKSVGEE